MTSTIASILNAKRNGAIIFGAYGFPVKRVVGVNLADETGGGGGAAAATTLSCNVTDLKQDFQQRMAMKLDRYFGEAQRKVLELVEIVFENVVTSDEVGVESDVSSANADAADAAAVRTDTATGKRNRKLTAVDNLYVIRICVEGRRCPQIINSPAKGRHGR